MKKRVAELRVLRKPIPGTAAARNTLALVDELLREGQRYPIIVTKDNIVLDGKRRLAAAIALNWPEVEVKPDKEIHEIERDELKKKLDPILRLIRGGRLTWIEEAQAVCEYILLARAIRYTSFRQLTDVLGMSLGSLHNAYNIGIASVIDPEGIFSCETKGTALELARDVMGREAVGEGLTVTHHGETEELIPIIYYGDPINCMRAIPDGLIDLVILNIPTDQILPPTEEFFPELFAELNRVCAPDAAGYLFYPKPITSKYFEVEIPGCIWQHTPKPNEEGEHLDCYTPFWFFSRGRGRINREYPNVITLPLVSPSVKTHFTQKPIALMRELISRTTEEKQRVLDPFCGVGGALAAAFQTGRKSIGIERDYNLYRAARKNLKLPGRIRRLSW